MLHFSSSQHYIQTSSMNTCFSKNAAYTEEPITAIASVPSSLACQEICQSTPQCLSFSWVSESYYRKGHRQVCYLHNDLGFMERSTFLTKYVYAGPKFCQPILEDQKEQGNECFLNNVVSLGRKMMNLANISSPFKCHRECQANINCNYFTWVVDEENNPSFRRLCSLFSKTESDVLLEWVYTKHRISGPKSCYTLDAHSSLVCRLVLLLKKQWRVSL